MRSGPASSVCKNLGQAIRINAVELFVRRKNIGVDLFDRAGVQLVLWPTHDTTQFTVTVGKAAEYACFNSPYPNAQANVCWVCADATTQLLRQSGYNLQQKMENDPFMVKNFNMDVVTRNTGSMAQFLRERNTSALFNGSLNAHFYSVGDLVFLTNNSALYLASLADDNNPLVKDTDSPSTEILAERRKALTPTTPYHVGIVIRGGKTLDEILVAQISYSAEGFFDPLVGRFQVITLKTYLYQDIVGGDAKPIPQNGQALQGTPLQQYILHGVPQP
jgi:hypothetical protein